ncbi:16S rRNA (uracil(1498)-N(3))-methyltransferase [Thalassotalea sp. PP2-459]|uniref:16S rRNA (uracil(1498)-N(3))-methyltransferase n=1 Tax=Thalassotalea sp. PP2-459 TaxID=1742724 RepID=UPI000943CAC1|nr:16S rRNA (uracil(1498)-N(3))-methyltransferase [Thalassotalea sp. PP2-459]OKY26335.1 16S rRNA (uracil(1498)-N(3))-methyltransferase [Thalassotalea sp. PP2-459]
MRNPRIFENQPFSTGDTVTLSDDAFGHAIRVLRLKSGDTITLFNGQLINNSYGEFQAVLTDVGKKSANAIIGEFTEVDNESPLNIHLGQGISRGERMDFTLQKSVELGVNTITPLFTDRCGVKLKGERLQKKCDQWQKIVISACEQSGRCTIPMVKPAISLEEWLMQSTSALKLNLHPKAEQSIMALPLSHNRIRLLIGPEGGLSDEEIAQSKKHEFNDVLLGPRVLRTETAALTAITALQCRLGDIK